MVERDCGERALLRAVDAVFHLLTPDGDKPTVGVGALLAEFGNACDVSVDGFGRLRHVELVSAAGDVVDGGSQVGHVGAGLADDRHRQGLDLAGKLGTHLLQGAVGLGGDQDPHSFGEQVRHECRRGVCLAGSRRSLDDGLSGLVDPVDDAALLLVDRQRKEVLVTD